MPKTVESMRRNPTILWTIAFITTSVVLLWLGWNSFCSYRNNVVTRRHDSQIVELHGVIIHLNEVLTMSARMAAASGDLRWEQRYQLFEPKLDVAIKKAIRLAPEAYSEDALAQTEAANIRLVDAEKRAFDLVRQSRLEEARNLLFSNDYERQKQIYTEGITRFATSIEPDLKLRELRSIIIHLDEVLTMSARMAAASGDLRWEQRYQVFEPQLDAAIKEAIKLAPEAYSGESAIQTDAANIKLVEKEKRAFELIHQKRLDEAREILFSDEYEQLKQTYANGMEQLAVGLQETANAMEHVGTRKAYLSIGLVTALIAVLLIGFLAVLRTTRRWQAALLRKNLQLAVQSERLERSNKDLEQFAYVASHDLREPLRKIVTFSDRLTQLGPTALGKDGVDYIHRMQNAALRMVILVDDLLEYARIGSEIKNLELVNLGDIVRDVITDMDVSISQSMAQVNIGALPQIHANKLQIKQIFLNLLSNAIKFQEKGKRPHVQISGRTMDPDWAEIRVEDNGIGFEKKYLDQIFEPLKRLHGRTEYEGVGIGLATCQRIVQNHGGTITAESEPGKGTTFIVTLPCRSTD